MSIKTSLNSKSKLAKIATFIIFLALIRCISEPFRLQYYTKARLTFDDIRLFLTGSLVAALGLLVMTMLFYFGKHKMVIATGVLTILILLVIKMTHLKAP